MKSIIALLGVTLVFFGGMNGVLSATAITECSDDPEDPVIFTGVDSGTLKSEDYDINGNATCYYRIEVDVTKTLAIELRGISLYYHNSDCDNDYLSISETNSSSFLMKECKTYVSYGEEFTWSQTNSVDIVFNVTSDGGSHSNSLTKKSFELTWESIETCNGNTATYGGISGVIRSPSYREYDYPCEYNVTVTEGKFIEFTLVHINSYGEYDECFYDSLRIYGGDDYSKLVKEFCGDKYHARTPKTFTSKSNKARIIFTVDNSYQEYYGKSFLMTYKEVNDPIIIYAAAGGAAGLVLIVLIIIFGACNKKLTCLQVTAPSQTRKVTDAELAKRRNKPTAGQQRAGQPKRTYQPHSKAQPSSKKTNKLNEKKPDIMIRYQWYVKLQVLEFEKQCKQAGYGVWLDMDQEMGQGAKKLDVMIRYPWYVKTLVLEFHEQLKQAGYKAFLDMEQTDEGGNEEEDGVEEAKKDEEAAQPKDESDYLAEVNRRHDNDGGTQTTVVF